MNNLVTTKYTLSTNALKIWAIIAMVCDHLPYVTETLQAQYYTFPWFLMHAFGRITAPIFFYLLALGYKRTSNANRYTLRLLIFALISYVPYIWYFENEPPNSTNFLHLNVIFTMLIGLLLIRSINEIRNIPLKAIAIVFCLLIGYWSDYGLYGLAMILICYLAAGSRRGTVFGMGAVIAVYFYTRTSSFFPESMSPIDYLPTLIQNQNTLFYFIVLLCQLLPLIFIARHRAWVPEFVERKPSWIAKWGFYIFYPAHITILLLVRLFVIN